MAHRIIDTEADIKAGMRALRRKCAGMRRAHDAAGDPPLRRREPGLEGLARIIVGQQLSVASAGAIWARTEKLVVPFEAPRLLAESDEALRGAGLSTGKIRTLRALASAIVDDGLDLTTLGDCPHEEITERLTVVKGIGPWTADIFAMFCLGRADAFAPGDLALQEAARLALDLDGRPGANDLADIAVRWRPWRGVAARMLWAYYAVAKTKGNALPA